MPVLGSITFRLSRPESPLPLASDFYRAPNTNAELAWKNFGGLSLADAYTKFLECPEIYQEDFMWMFPNAFEYYFPIIDKYLREVDINDDDDWTMDDGCHAWILGCAVHSQFHWKDGTTPREYVVQEISSLSEFVQGNLKRYSVKDDERTRIRNSWVKVDEEGVQF